MRYTIKQAEANVKEKKRFLKEAETILDIVKSGSPNDVRYKEEVAQAEVEFVEAENDLAEAESDLELLKEEKENG